MAFRIEKEKTGMKGDFAVPLMEPVILDIKKKDILNEIVDQINTDFIYNYSGNEY